MRLIDADALIDEIKNHLWDWETVNGITAQTVLKQTITDVENQPTASPWHRVEEPPKQNGAFAVACVYDGKLYWYKGIYFDGKWLREGDGIEMPAEYWMPVPEPPKEDA